MILKSTEVAIGKYKVKFSFESKISPGSFPEKGMCLKKIKNKPSAKNTTPIIITIFPKGCIIILYF
jgi:hypothetical protein